MPVTYEIKADYLMAVTHFVGRTAMSDILNYFDALQRDRRFEKGFGILAHLGEAEVPSLGRDAHALASQFAKRLFAEWPIIPCAVVCDAGPTTEFIKGFAQTYDLDPLVVKVVSTEEEAISWLREVADEPPSPA